jgi:hypothetical protein
VWRCGVFEPIRQIPRLTIRSSRGGPPPLTAIDEAHKIDKTTWKRRPSTVCFLTAISVAMVGWLSAFGWVTVAVAKWLSD